MAVPSAPDPDLLRFLAVLRSLWGEDLVSVVLFGSRARGEAGAGSDTDLLVIRGGFPGSRLERHREVFSAARSVSDEFAARVSVVPLTPQEAKETKPFYLGMLSGHAILHDREDFFRDVLRRLEARLRELGAERRVDADGYEYWVLKKDLRPGEAVEV